MARTKNPNTPEDGKPLGTVVEQDVAAKFRILAMVNGSTVSDFLRELVQAHVDENPVTITVNGKALGEDDGESNTGAKSSKAA